MFAGLTSRCTTPWRCAAASAAPTCSTTASAALERQRPVAERVAQAAAAQVAHDQIRPVRLAPVVVERHDVRVLEPGHELRLGLEAADELRIVGQRRADDLHRHLAPDLRLERAVDDPERPLADPLEQLGTRAAAGATTSSSGSCRSTCCSSHRSSAEGSSPSSSTSTARARR